MKDPSQAEQFLPGNGKTQWCWDASLAEHTFSSSVLLSIYLFIFCIPGFVCDCCGFFPLVCLFKAVEQSELTLSYLGLEWDCRQEHAQPGIAYIRNTPLKIPCCHFLCFPPCLRSFRVCPCRGDRKRNAWRSMLSSYEVPFSTQSNVVYWKVSCIFWTEVSLLDVLESADMQRLNLQLQEFWCNLTSTSLFSRKWLLHPCVWSI